MQQSKISYTEAVKAVCLATDVDYATVLSSNRNRKIVVARQLITYFAYNYAYLTHECIAHELRYAHHSSCCINITRVNKYMSTKKEGVIELINKVNNLLKITA